MIDVGLDRVWNLQSCSRPSRSRSARVRLAFVLASVSVAFAVVLAFVPVAFVL